MAATPLYNELLNVIWGSYYDGAARHLFSAASGVIIGTNPSYSPVDFFSLYPNFGGTPVQFSYTCDGTTSILTNVTNTSNLVLGSYVSGNGIKSGSYIIDINDNSVTLNQTTTSATNATGIDYAAPVIPLPVLLSYIYLATSSLVKERYQEMWNMVMALFIAHYCTLWLMAQSSTPNSSAQQIAASGMAMGIKTSKSAGDVSNGMQPLLDLEGWGSFQLTSYGQQFATIAKVIGSMPILFH